MEYKACAITGHRPSRFKWKYNENNNGCKRLKRRLKVQLIHLYEKGVRRFYDGGALGVDLWSGELLLELKEQPEYSDIELILVLPFAGHDRDWDPKSRRRLSVLRQHSTEVVIAGTAEHDSVTNYRLRNQYLVDHADCLLAVYDNDRNLRSGTMQTVNYARRKGLSITLIHPDSAAVSYENQN
ncbi:SLOG family protein [Flintibacter muris]|uniref:SLOG family protein n=1 Tax=Flintibacter muris TaxID=2941327 RepID=UPI00203CCEC1|nr:SLOG family protein [Flintibacter muris]